MKKITNFIKSNIFFILAIIYLIWPFDLIAEIFAFAGGPLVLLDDAGFLGIAILQKIYSNWKNSKKLNELEQIKIEANNQPPMETKI